MDVVGMKNFDTDPAVVVDADDELEEAVDDISSSDECVRFMDDLIERSSVATDDDR